MMNKIKKAMRKFRWDLINQITDVREQEDQGELTASQTEDMCEKYFIIFIKNVTEEISRK